MGLLRNLIIVLIPLSFLVAACKDQKNQSQAALENAAYEHTCYVQVTPKGPNDEFSGTGISDKDKEANEAAWKDVCGKLPEADRLDCREGAKWASSPTLGSATVNGKTTFTVTIKIRRVQKVEGGVGKSDLDGAAACKSAIENACQALGAQGNCVAAGTHELEGQAKEKKLKTQ